MGDHRQSITFLAAALAQSISFLAELNHIHYVLESLYITLQSRVISSPQKYFVVIYRLGPRKT